MSEDKKYEFTGKTDVNGLKEIRVLKDYVVPGLRAGTVGGCIESEKNLEQKSRCWVYKGSIVSGNAVIKDNACVDEDSEVSGKAVISDNASILGGSLIAGNVVVEGDASLVNCKLENDEYFHTGYHSCLNF